MLKSLLIVGATGLVAGGVGFVYGRYLGYTATKAQMKELEAGLKEMEKTRDADLDASILASLTPR